MSAPASALAVSAHASEAFADARCDRLDPVFIGSWTYAHWENATLVAIRGGRG